MKRAIAIALISCVGLMAQKMPVGSTPIVVKVKKTSKLSKVGHALKMTAETLGVVVLVGALVVASGGTNVKIYN